jgi:hypothetical protein
LTRKRLSTAYVVRGWGYVEARMRLSDLSWEKTIGAEGICTLGAWRIEEMKVYHAEFQPRAMYTGKRKHMVYRGK